MQNDVNGDSRHPSADDIDDVVGLYVDRGETHEHVERHHAPEEPLVTQSPGEEHQDGRHPHMTAGEGCCGSFACCMGILHHMVEESVAPSWHRQCLLVGGEVMAHVREHPCCDILQAHGLIVVLRTSDGQEDKDDVVDEKRCEDDKLRTVELLITEEEREQRHYGNHREIGGVA